MRIATLAVLVCIGVRSTTFRGLVDGIGRTDALVYVEAGVCAFGHLDACLLPYTASPPAARYLRIVLTQPVPTGCRNRVIALIGHDLRHALEVAERPDVIDVPSMTERTADVSWMQNDKRRPGRSK